MKSGKHKKRKYSKQTKLTCPNCEMIFYAVTHYKDHMTSSKKCHSVNPYCCKFCDYVAFDSNGLNQHLMKNQSCTYHYEELKVTTGLLPNIGKEINIDDKDNLGSSPKNVILLGSFTINLLLLFPGKSSLE